MTPLRMAGLSVSGILKARRSRIEAGAHVRGPWQDPPADHAGRKM